MDRARCRRRRLGWLLPLIPWLACGCQTVKTPEAQIARSEIPRELSKTTLPDYIVEPPDVIRVVFRNPDPGALPQDRLLDGERLVRPDGKISLDYFGDIYVTGLTTDEIKEKVIIHLRKFFSDQALGLVRQDEEGQVRHVPPVESEAVFVDVEAFNSKFYYVQGDVGQPNRVPIMGNETVLDAINQVGGLLATAAPQNIRLVRPAPPGACCQQVLPVNYAAIVYAGDTTTNYQLLPGDRLVVYRDPIVRFTGFLERLYAPFQITFNAALNYALTLRAINTIDEPLNFGTGNTVR